MIFALIVGIILGVSGLGTPLAILILAASLAAKAVVDVLWERVPYLGGVSPFVVYCRNLERAGEPIGQAWISYAMQLLVFGALLGMAAYALVRYFA